MDTSKMNGDTQKLRVDQYKRQRAIMRNNFRALKDELPVLSHGDEKEPQVRILVRAKEYIRTLKSQNASLKSGSLDGGIPVETMFELQSLRERVGQLEMQLAASQRSHRRRPLKSLKRRSNQGSGGTASNPSLSDTELPVSPMLSPHAPAPHFTNFAGAMPTAFLSPDRLLQQPHQPPFSSYRALLDSATPDMSLRTLAPSAQHPQILPHLYAAAPGTAPPPPPAASASTSDGYPTIAPLPAGAVAVSPSRKSLGRSRFGNRHPLSKRSTGTVADLTRRSHASGVTGSHGVTPMLNGVDLTHALANGVSLPPAALAGLPPQNGPAHPPPSSIAGYIVTQSGQVLVVQGEAGGVPVSGPQVEQLGSKNEVRVTECAAAVGDDSKQNDVDRNTESELPETPRKNDGAADSTGSCTEDVDAKQPVSSPAAPASITVDDHHGNLAIDTTAEDSAAHDLLKEPELGPDDSDVTEAPGEGSTNGSPALKRMMSQVEKLESSVRPIAIAECPKSTELPFRPTAAPVSTHPPIYPTAAGTPINGRLITTPDGKLLLMVPHGPAPPGPTEGVIPSEQGVSDAESALLRTRAAIDQVERKPGQRLLIPKISAATTSSTTASSGSGANTVKRLISKADSSPAPPVHDQLPVLNHVPPGAVIIPQPGSEMARPYAAAPFPHPFELNQPIVMQLGPDGQLIPVSMANQQPFPPSPANQQPLQSQQPITSEPHRPITNEQLAQMAAAGLLPPHFAPPGFNPYSQQLHSMYPPPVPPHPSQPNEMSSPAVSAPTQTSLSTVTQPTSSLDGSIPSTNMDILAQAASCLITPPGSRTEDSAQSQKESADISTETAISPDHAAKPKPKKKKKPTADLLEQAASVITGNGSEFNRESSVTRLKAFVEDMPVLTPERSSGEKIDLSLTAGAASAWEAIAPQQHRPAKPKRVYQRKPARPKKPVTALSEQSWQSLFADAVERRRSDESPVKDDQKAANEARTPSPRRTALLSPPLDDIRSPARQNLWSSLTKSSSDSAPTRALHVDTGGLSEFDDNLPDLYIEKAKSKRPKKKAPADGKARKNVSPAAKKTATKSPKHSPSELPMDLTLEPSSKSGRKRKLTEKGVEMAAVSSRHSPRSNKDAAEKKETPVKDTSLCPPPPKPKRVRKPKRASAQETDANPIQISPDAVPTDLLAAPAPTATNVEDETRNAVDEIYVPATPAPAFQPDETAPCEADDKIEPVKDDAKSVEVETNPSIQQTTNDSRSASPVVHNAGPSKLQDYPMLPSVINFSEADLPSVLEMVVGNQAPVLSTESTEQKDSADTNNNPAKASAKDQNDLASNPSSFQAQGDASDTREKTSDSAPQHVQAPRNQANQQQPPEPPPKKRRYDPTPPKLDDRTELDRSLAQILGEVYEPKCVAAEPVEFDERFSVRDASTVVVIDRPEKRTPSRPIEQPQSVKKPDSVKPELKLEAKTPAAVAVPPTPPAQPPIKSPARSQETTSNASPPKKTSSNRTVTVPPLTTDSSKRPAKPSAPSNTNTKTTPYRNDGSSSGAGSNSSCAGQKDYRQQLMDNYNAHMAAASITAAAHQQRLSHLPANDARLSHPNGDPSRYYESEARAAYGNTTDMSGKAAAAVTSRSSSVAMFNLNQHMFDSAAASVYDRESLQRAAAMTKSPEHRGLGAAAALEAAMMHQRGFNDPAAFVHPYFQPSAAVQRREQSLMHSGFLPPPPPAHEKAASAAAAAAASGSAIDHPLRNAFGAFGGFGGLYDPHRRPAAGSVPPAAHVANFNFNSLFGEHAAAMASSVEHQKQQLQTALSERALLERNYHQYHGAGNSAALFGASLDQRLGFNAAGLRHPFNLNFPMPDH